MRSYLADLRILLDGCHGRLAAAFALFAGSAAMDLACMAVLPVFVVAALSPGPGAALPLPWLAQAFGEVSAVAISGAVIALFLARAGLMLAVGSRMAALAESVRERVVSRLVGQLLAMPYEATMQRPVAGEITAVAHYSVNFSLHVVLPLLRLGLDFLTIVVVLAFVARIEPEAVLVTAAVFGAVGLAYYAGIRRTTSRHSRRLAALQAELTHQVTQAISSPREVRVYGLQQHFSGRIGENLRATTLAQATLGAVYWLPRAIGELTLIGLAIVYMVFKARSGADATLVVSNLSVLAFAGLRLLPAFAQGMSNLGYLQAGRQVARVLADKLRLAPPARLSEPQPQDALPPAPAEEAFESLELAQVSFRYEGAQADALRDISLRIRRGQSIGVVGASGAGKSTLGDLLLGLLRPAKGQVLINGRPGALDSPHWWRLAGFVPQSPYIANDTLLRNVAYGIPDGRIDLALVRKALDLAQLQQVAAALPQGLDTLLGDAGIRLSGGQRQRVAIARALYRQRDFLVLDEATSALDQDTEREVIGSIEALKGTITTFIIAHRVSTLQNCDFIMELRDGGIVDVRAPG